MQRHLKHIHPELGIAPPKSMDTSKRRDLKLSDSDFTEESNLVEDSIHLDAEDSDVKEPNIKEEFSASNIENSSITSIDKNIDEENENNNLEGIPFRCNHCHLDFPSQATLTKHKKIGCIVEKNLSCEYCGKTFARAQNLVNHRLTHKESGNSFPCNHCKKDFDNFQALKNHEKFGCPATEKPFSCQYCNAKFTIERNMIYHQLHKCMEINPNQKQELKKNRKRVTGKCSRRDPLHVICDICESAVHSTHIRGHMRVQHGKSERIMRRCPWCEKLVNSTSMLPHAYKHHYYGRFPCSRCDFVAYFAKDLISHASAEHGDKEQSCNCPVCKRSFPLHELESHHKECMDKKMKIIYDKSIAVGKRAKVCEFCGKTVTNGHYQDHLQSHARQKAVKEGDESKMESLFTYCDKCGKRLSINTITKHKKICYDDGNYPCPLCPLVFNKNVLLTAHHMKVHSTDEKYQCKQCSYRSGILAHLKSHEKTHVEDRFQCKFCPKKLKTKKYLLYHERQHTGEKPFKCSMCTNAFVCRNGLRQHMSGVHHVVGQRGGTPGWKRKQNKSVTPT